MWGVWCGAMRVCINGTRRNRPFHPGKLEKCLAEPDYHRVRCGAMRVCINGNGTRRVYVCTARCGCDARNRPFHPGKLDACLAGLGTVYFYASKEKLGPFFQAFLRAKMHELHIFLFHTESAILRYLFARCEIKKQAEKNWTPFQPLLLTWTDFGSAPKSQI